MISPGPHDLVQLLVNAMHDLPGKATLGDYAKAIIAHLEQRSYQIISVPVRNPAGLIVYCDRCDHIAHNHFICDCVVRGLRPTLASALRPEPRGRVSALAQKDRAILASVLRPEPRGRGR